jgi:hypothetical protein
MSMIILRNNKNQVIGRIQTVHNGIKQIRCNKGILLGWYDPASDKTVDARTGNWFSFGDQLTMLLN